MKHYNLIELPSKKWQLRVRNTILGIPINRWANVMTPFSIMNIREYTKRDKMAGNNKLTSTSLNGIKLRVK